MTKHNDIILFETGVYSTILGAVSLSVLPAAYGGIMLAAGIGSMALHFLDKSDKYKALFESMGLQNKKGEYPRFKGLNKSDSGYKLVFTLPKGLCSNDFSKHKQAIEQYLNASNTKISYANNNVFVEVVEIELETEYPFEKVERKGGLIILTGKSMSGVEVIDLSIGEPHVLISGESGSGKSTLLRGIITNIILTTDPNSLRLHLIDLKHGAEFRIFEKCKNVASFSRTRKEAEKILYKINAEIERRYNLFYENDCVDIKEYNQKFRNSKLCRELVIIDEFADLKDEKDSIGILEELSAKARACGVHLVIATQRPDAKVLTGRIKANIPNVIGLKTMNEINSRIIIDHAGLETLRGEGRGILKRAGKEVEIQAMYLKPEQARDLVKHTYVEKKETNEMKKEPPKTQNKGNQPPKTEHKTNTEAAGEVMDLSFLDKI